MSNLPHVLGELISDRLSAAGVPGASIAINALKAYLQRRSDEARQILLEEFRLGSIGFRAVVGVADLGQVQASIAPAYIAAREQRPIGLAQRADALGDARKGTNHAARLEPAGGQ